MYLFNVNHLPSSWSCVTAVTSTYFTNVLHCKSHFFVHCIVGQFRSSPLRNRAHRLHYTLKAYLVYNMDELGHTFIFKNTQLVSSCPLTTNVPLPSLHRVIWSYESIFHFMSFNRNLIAYRLTGPLLLSLMPPLRGNTIQFQPILDACKQCW